MHTITLKTATFLLLTCLALSLSAQNDTFTLEGGDGEVGQVVTLGVYVRDISGNALDTTGLDGFFDFSMKLSYDAALVEDITFVAAGISQTGFPGLFANLELPAGNAQFLCSFLNPAPMVLDGPAQLFCNLEVTPSAAAAGQTIVFSFDDPNTYIVGSNGNSVELRDALGNLDVALGSIAVDGTGGSAPVIGGFSADPVSVTQGDSATLSWSVTDADTVAINQGVGQVAATGSTSVTPSVTTTYTLSATNQFGTATRDVTVTVTAPGLPQINSFSVFPVEIVAGAGTTLSWATTDADTVSINQGVGTVSASGSANVSPGSETTYTLTATNGGGSVTADVTVEVVAALEIVSFTATPAQIEEGGNSTLSWQVLGASSVTLNGASVAATGSQTVSPTQTTTYTLAAQGPLNQSQNATATVRVSGDAALSLDLAEVAFGSDQTSRTVALTVNAAGVFDWTIQGLPHWLNATPSTGTVDGERATEITLTLDRTRLFPGQTVSATPMFVSEGLLGTELSTTAMRAESADETYLYYPLIQADDLRRGEITVINHGTEQADLLLQLFNRDGSLPAAPIQTQIPAGGGYRLSPNPNLLDQVFWAVATLSASDGAPQASGCVSVRSNDGQELYGLSAETEKSDFLYVPHIAGDTTVFFTQSSVVNLANESRTSSVDTGTGFQIAAQDSGTQAFFSYEDVLGGAIENLTWSSISFDQAVPQATIGAEVFGFKDFPRTVGVGLNQKAFNTLYFVHVAEDLASFWTGVVVINLADVEVDMQIEPYNRDGELIGGGFLQPFAAGEKKTFVVLGAREDFGPGTAWVKVTSPSPIAGFELFANPAGTAGDTFAGLESTGTLSRKLAFRHTEEGAADGGLTAVALINPGDVAASLTFHLVAADGTIKESVPRPALEPKHKLTSAARSIFTQAQIAFGDIILVDSDQEIAGFELYGDFTATLGALLAVPLQE